MTVPLRLVRYIYGQYLRTFGVVLGAIVGIFLVIDFADRAHHYTGRGVLGAVLELYACKSLVVAYQLTPAALLLAAGACISTLRRRGEITAMGALTIRPVTIHLSLALGCLTVIATAIGVDQIAVHRVGLDQSLLGWAGQRADELMATRFRQWGDFSTYYGPRQWFRGKDRVYFLRRSVDDGFADVSIFQLSSGFRLASRIDAEHMQAQPDGSWLMLNGSERTFSAEGRSHQELFQERRYRFTEGPGSFQIRRGRPELMTMRQLNEQIALRERMGLPYTSYILAFHSKLAYPLMGLPASILSAVLALRRGRKGHLTAALIEGVAVVALLWCANALFSAAAGAGQVSPAVAAWSPVALLTAGALVALVRVE